MSSALESAPLVASTAAATADHAEAARHHRHRWWILVTLAVAQLMVVLDTTVVNIALPSAQSALGFDDSGRQWVVTSYALAFGSLLLLGGRLADLFGRKNVFLVGLAGFAVASAVGGVAGNLEVLVAARTVQGAFGALLAPAALSLLSTTFVEPKERGKAFGIYGAVAGGGAAVGLLLGGVLTEYASWRWCMLINVAFAAVAVVGAVIFFGSQHNIRRHTPLDVPGTILVTSGLFSLVYGFAHAENNGWDNVVTLGFITVGAALTVAFVVAQTQVRHPLLPMRVVLDRNRGGSYFAMFAVGVGMFALFLFLTYYLQQNLGFSPVESGLAYLPLTGALIIVSQAAVNILGRRVGPRWIIAPGMAVCAAGLLLLTRLDVSSSYAKDVLPGIIIFGVGLGLVFAAALADSTSGVRTEDAGIASALVNTGQQVGGSIGVALLSTVAASSITRYADSHEPGVLLAQAAAIHGYTTAFSWAALIFAFGALVTGLILRGNVAASDEDSSEA